QDRLHRWRAWIAEDRPGAESARSELHASLEPADGVAADECIDRFVDERHVTQQREPSTDGAQTSLDVLLSERRPEERTVHGVVLPVDDSRLASIQVICTEGRAQRPPRIAGCRLDPNTTKVAISENIPVRNAV